MHESGPSVGSAVLPNTSWLDVETDLHQLDLPAIERWIKGIIADNLHIERYWHERPYWHIDGVGILSCTGTHVAMTSEIGEVRLTVEPIQHQRVRVFATVSGSE